MDHKSKSEPDPVSTLTSKGASAVRAGINKRIEREIFGVRDEAACGPNTSIGADEVVKAARRLGIRYRGIVCYRCQRWRKPIAYKCIEPIHMFENNPQDIIVTEKQGEITCK